MDKLFNRSFRIAQELQKNIAFIIQHSLKDPRIKTIITVSEVRLSKDLSYAQVFVSFLETNSNLTVKKVLILLNRASGYIRKLLCKKMNLRIIPIIVFFHDDSFFKGNKISKLLNILTEKNNITL
ncbi:30S ribosome-binding factor RbfA [Buchnera aphidicola]|jgi:ribosome-binding factor A|uniref:Ribosome-binding factor A n=1 Tax=Buchnera aphidicola subsp. Schizaphis graminum (strain Sg) TaxID=198804 RepID=RBFA_BUCAP|nr:30S ribosome-binding factor RbfA [Buchnera aphidicola]Q8K9H2.1 RecName: Full=Ribosome-binding factor A [Buchnera aphidicola str. Sg (Schizaphis graminum)]AAM67917.1 ribosome-binding factor A [Buchnera aphidicola str. Sg (Schizaphis graminum)]AWI49590.1 30S ribosome-binding factor RbfA [Buchnera aphidicola (Schizaphis graminum)]